MTSLRSAASNAARIPMSLPLMWSLCPRAFAGAAFANGAGLRNDAQEARPEHARTQRREHQAHHLAHRA